MLPPVLRTRADLARMLAAATNYEERLPLRGVRASFDLDRVRRLLADLGDPQDACGDVLHVAGSKGKGTTVRLAAHALKRAGRGPVGLFTSPHLEDLAERIALDGVRIDDETLVGAAETLRPHLARRLGTRQAATFFEVTMAMAWIAFRAAGTRSVALEVGLGGRLDATNVVAPRSTVITHIELEHTRLLGDTVEAIAREKAGIVKPGVPVVVGAQGKAADVIEAIAHERGAPCRLRGRDFTVLRHEVLPGARGRAWLRTRDGEVVLDLPAAGRPVAENAVLAYEALRDMGLSPGELDDAFADAKLPAVLETVARDPRVVVDGAHTTSSAAAVAATMAEAFPDERPRVLVVALLKEKDASGILAPLAAWATHVIATQVQSPRARPARETAGVIERLSNRAVERVADPATAYARARRLASPHGVALVTGSLYLAGAVRALARFTPSPTGSGVGTSHPTGPR
ncbi:MAG: folylpolyglutamate synthase/dihydrofolate synthase family protein [Planctomycetota bacterium]